MENQVRPLHSYSISLGNEMSHARGWLPHFKGQIYCNSEELLQQKAEYEQELQEMLEYTDLYDEFYGF